MVTIALRTTPILKTNSSCCLPPFRSLNLRPHSVQLIRYGKYLRKIPNLALSVNLSRRLYYRIQANVRNEHTFQFMAQTNLAFLARRLRSLGYTIFSTREPATELHKLGVLVTEIYTFGDENKDALVVVDPQDYYFSLLAYLEEEDLEDNKFRRILDLKVSRYKDDLLVSNHVTEGRMDLLEDACTSGVSVITGCSGGGIGDRKAIERCNKYGISLLFAQVSNSRQ